MASWGEVPETSGEALWVPEAWELDYLQLLFSVFPQSFLKASCAVPQRLALEGQCVHLVLQVMTQEAQLGPLQTLQPGEHDEMAPV